LEEGKKKAPLFSSLTKPPQGVQKTPVQQNLCCGNSPPLLHTPKNFEKPVFRRAYTQLNLGEYFFPMENGPILAFIKLCTQLNPVKLSKKNLEDKIRPKILISQDLLKPPFLPGKVFPPINKPT